MRGYADTDKLTNEAVVSRNPLDGKYRAALRIAGHGSYYGNWRDDKLHADDDLLLLKLKHLPKPSTYDGISAQQRVDFGAALDNQVCLQGDHPAMIIAA